MDYSSYVSSLFVNFSREFEHPQLFKVLTAIPLWEYVVFFSILIVILLYLFFELHILSDIFFGDPVKLIYNSNSRLAELVISGIKFERFWPTPWLCSPDFQTVFLHFHVYHPKVSYTREILVTPDGGTLALDWSKPSNGKVHFHSNDAVSTPIVIVVPGLTSDSRSQYVLHIVREITKRNFFALVCNHRGLGGVSLTSNQFYNAGWTDDLHYVIDHLKKNYSNSKLFIVGTSLGANIMVKYLGEREKNDQILACAAIGCPWDLVVVDRFMRRKSKQKLYGMGLTQGLKDFIDLHKEKFSCLVNWEHLFRSRSVRDFDDRITRYFGNYETVDTYYRKCSSAQFVPNVKHPLLCFSALDDPICSKEAIPFDECKLNKNVILGITKHGGHLAFLQGMFATKIWWVKPTCDFFEFIFKNSSLIMDIQEKNQNQSTFSNNAIHFKIEENINTNNTINNQSKSNIDSNLINSDSVIKHRENGNRGVFLPLDESLNEKGEGEEMKKEEKGSDKEKGVGLRKEDDVKVVEEEKKEKEENVSMIKRSKKDRTMKNEYKENESNEENGSNKRKENNELVSIFPQSTMVDPIQSSSPSPSSSSPQQVTSINHFSTTTNNTISKNSLPKMDEKIDKKHNANESNHRNLELENEECKGEKYEKKTEEEEEEEASMISNSQLPKSLIPLRMKKKSIFHSLSENEMKYKRAKRRFLSFSEMQKLIKFCAYVTNGFKEIKNECVRIKRLLSYISFIASFSVLGFFLLFLHSTKEWKKNSKSRLFKL